eukprot:scaffold324_cov326-Pavlova_lutheri.AAC.71
MNEQYPGGTRERRLPMSPAPLSLTNMCAGHVDLFGIFAGHLLKPKCQSQRKGRCLLLELGGGFVDQPGTKICVRISFAFSQQVIKAAVYLCLNVHVSSLTGLLVVGRNVRHVHGLPVQKVKPRRDPGGNQGRCKVLLLARHRCASGVRQIFDTFSNRITDDWKVQHLLGVQQDFEDFVPTNCRKGYDGGIELRSHAYKLCILWPKELVLLPPALEGLPHTTRKEKHGFLRLQQPVQIPSRYLNRTELRKDIGHTPTLRPTLCKECRMRQTSQQHFPV